MYDHETYLSPLTWRYGSDEMRRIWSTAHQRRLFRRIWVALAEAQADYGLVTPEQVADLRAHAQDIDIERAHEIEAETHHDLMAEVKTFAEQCPVGGGIIHLGATSMDIEDNADALRLCEGLDLVLERLRALLAGLAEQIEARADQACMGYTHLQPAEPTTVGYRLAQYGFDLLTDLEELQRTRDGLRGKGIKGATGTSASYVQLLASPPATGATGSSGSPDAGEMGRARDLEAKVMAKLGLEAFPVATQTYPRKQDWLVLNALAGLAGSLYKFAFDLRILQAQPFGEWNEPFGSRQVGSSAMPFKRNPIRAENMDSLARLVAALPRVAWDNAAHSLLERTLDDSGKPAADPAPGLPTLRRTAAAGQRHPAGAGCPGRGGGPQPGALWYLCRHGAPVDGTGQGRRRPPGDARTDPAAQHGHLGRGPAGRAQSPGRPAGR